MNVLLRPLSVTEMPHARILSARMVVLATQDSLVTEKFAKVSKKLLLVNFNPV